MPRKTKVKVQIAKKIKNIKKEKVQKQKQTVTQKVSINIPKELAKQGYSNYPIPPRVSYEPLPIRNFQADPNYLQQLVSNPIQRRLEIDELKNNVKKIEDNINKKLNQIELNRRVHQDKLDDRLKFLEDDIVYSQYEGVGLKIPLLEPAQEYPIYRRRRVGSLPSESYYGIGLDIEPEEGEIPERQIPIFLQDEKGGLSLSRKPEESREEGDFYRVEDFPRIVIKKYYI